MNHEALKELRDILKLPDRDGYWPEQVREEQLKMWVDRWLVEVSFTQAVVDTKYLTSEYHDTIKLKLAQDIAEDIAETCAAYKTSDKKVSASIVAFRRKVAVK